MSAATPASAAPARCILNGRAVKSCTILAVQANGAEVKTIEGLADGDNFHPVQEGFREKHGLQCGYCTPGMIMTAVHLLETNPDPKRRRDQARPRRQSLPLHRLRQHRRVDQMGAQRKNGRTKNVLRC